MCQPEKHFQKLPCFIPASCIVLYTHRCSRLNYRTANMRCSVSHTCNAKVSHTCNKQTSMTTNVVDDTAYSPASMPTWMWTIVADGQKFPAVRRLSSRLLHWSKNAIFTYPTCIWCPRLGWSRRNFVEILRTIKLQSLGCHAALISHFCRTLTCSGQTDGHMMTANTTLA